jgi:hypothetical protein
VRYRAGFQMYPRALDPSAHHRTHDPTLTPPTVIPLPLSSGGERSDVCAERRSAHPVGASHAWRHATRNPPPPHGPRPRALACRSTAGTSVSRPGEEVSRYCHAGLEVENDSLAGLEVTYDPLALAAVTCECLAGVENWYGVRIAVDAEELEAPAPVRSPGTGRAPRRRGPLGRHRPVPAAGSARAPDPAQAARGLLRLVNPRELVSSVLRRRRSYRWSTGSSWCRRRR